MPASSSDRPLRADAARNRERLLASARELFNERGLDVTLNDIAHHAGVGVGTAYRRFADKYEVLDSLFDQRIDQMEEIGRVALAEPDPWQGFVTYLERALDLQSRDKALAQLLSRDRVRPEQHDTSRSRQAPLVEAIVERAIEAGVVRADLRPTDVVFMLIGLNQIAHTTRDRAPGLARRYLWQWLDGVRAPAPTTPTELPVDALTTEQTHRLLGRRDTAGLTPAT